MNKNFAHGKNKHFENWRVKTLNRCGPVGVDLLCDFLNWDIDLLDPADFKHFDFREELLRPWLRKHNEQWRPQLRNVQREIRQDLLSVLRPAPLNEDEEIIHTWSPRQTRFWHLLNKLASMKYQVRLRLEYSDVGPSAKKISKEGMRAWTVTKVKIEGDTFGVTDEIIADEPRAEIYGLLRAALKTGDIANLRICTNKQCQRFFVSRRGREQCGDECRNRVNNVARSAAGYFKKTYQVRKRAKLNAAKKLLGREPTHTMIRQAIQKTGLSRKALERAGLIDPDL